VVPTSLPLFLFSSPPLFLSFSLPRFFLPLSCPPAHQLSSLLAMSASLSFSLFLTLHELSYPFPAYPFRFCGTLSCARVPNADVTGAAVESIQMLELTHALAALEGCDAQSLVGAGGGDGKGAREGQATCLFRLICSSQVSSSFVPLSPALILLLSTSRVVRERLLVLHLKSLALPLICGLHLHACVCPCVHVSDQQRCLHS